MNYSEIQSILGNDASYLLNHECKKIPQQKIAIPHADSMAQNFFHSNRSDEVLRNLEKMYAHGRLRNTGYLSILPVDQGIEHTAGASFAKNIDYFNPENIIKLAIEGGCNAIASTLGILGMFSKKYADHIPFIVKVNHNELLSYPNSHDQIPFASVKQAYELGARGIGATIYFGSKESRRQIQEISQSFYEAHQLGMFTILWCYTRNPAFQTKGEDYHFSADITGQANYLGVTIEADIIKQKLPTTNGGFKAVEFSKYDEKMYTELSSSHPIDLCRYQVLNNYAGLIPLINSGGASGENDLHAAVKRAVINKRAGGSGLILGRKAFQKPLEQGIGILHAVQDVYLEKQITIA